MHLFLMYKLLGVKKMLLEIDTIESANNLKRVEITVLQPVISKAQYQALSLIANALNTDSVYYDDRLPDDLAGCEIVIGLSEDELGELEQRKIDFKAQNKEVCRVALLFYYLGAIELLGR